MDERRSARRGVDGVRLSIVLARLVAPDEFGRTAVAVFLGVLAQAVAQLGTGSFLVSHKAPTRSHFEAASWVSLGVGSSGPCWCWRSRSTLAPIWFGERTAYFAALSAPVWLLAGLTAVPYRAAPARAQLRTARPDPGELERVGPVAAVVLAVFGLEGESIVLGGVVTAAVTAAHGVGASRGLRVRGGTRPRCVRSAQLRRPCVRVVRSSSPASRNIDYVLLAAFIPAFQVGLYMRAFALGSDYQSKISQMLLNVAFPVLSRATSLDEIRRLRARMVRVHALVLFPLLFGLIAVAPDFVPWIYGERWAGAGELTADPRGRRDDRRRRHRHRAAAAGHWSRACPVHVQPRRLRRRSPLAVLAAVPFGVTAVCVAVVAVRLVTFVALQYLVVERKVGIPILETVRDDVIAALDRRRAAVARDDCSACGCRWTLGFRSSSRWRSPGAVGPRALRGCPSDVLPGRRGATSVALFRRLSLTRSLPRDPGPQRRRCARVESTDAAFADQGALSWCGEPPRDTATPVSMESAHVTSSDSAVHASYSPRILPLTLSVTTCGMPRRSESTWACSRSVTTTRADESRSSPWRRCSADTSLRAHIDPRASASLTAGPRPGRRSSSRATASTALPRRPEPWRHPVLRRHISGQSSAALGLVVRPGQYEQIPGRGLAGDGASRVRTRRRARGGRACPSRCSANSRLGSSRTSSVKLGCASKARARARDRVVAVERDALRQLDDRVVRGNPSAIARAGVDAMARGRRGCRRRGGGPVAPRSGCLSCSTRYVAPGVGMWTTRRPSRRRAASSPRRIALSPTLAKCGMSTQGDRALAGERRVRALRVSCARRLLDDPLVAHRVAWSPRGDGERRSPT